MSVVPPNQGNRRAPIVPTRPVKLVRMAYTVDINPDDPKSVEAALRTEWLLTNGLGGFAMGTLLGVNTRRYHGLLIVAAKPPVGRIVALHSMIDRCTIGEHTIDFATQQFTDDHGQPLLHPEGFRWLTNVVVEPPHRITWTYRVHQATLRRRLSLDAGRHAARVEYEIDNAPPGVQVSIRPLMPLRDFHALDHEGQGHAILTSATADEAIVQRDGVRVKLAGRTMRGDPQWWRGFAYQVDRERGQDWREDLWSPGVYEGEAATHVSASATITCELLDAPTPRQTAVTKAKENGVASAPTPMSSSQRAIAVAAKAFVVARDSAKDGWSASIIAGYPWFGDWGRDTMIVLPGLMLCTGRMDEARAALQCFARHLRNGLIPNLFDDYGGAAHYNTVDASLWFVHAVHALTKADGPQPVSPELVRACRAIVNAYRKGTDFNIHMDADGLIVAGDESTQLTWMDAARDGVVFTPRCGKAVEINALWHNALIAFSELTDDASERNELIMLARQVAASFRSAFWWEQRQCLHDCLAPMKRDEASVNRAPSAASFAADDRLRPNQIFAASLPFSPLNDVQQRAVVKIVGERLLTPFGLRTLDRDDPKYKPRYEGSLFERDAAYHQGTVWPWLIGPYCEALLRVEKFSDEAKQRVRGILQPLLDEMSNAAGGRCLGQIAEVYDAEPPQRPSGCPAQAWSVAEVLRVLTLVS